MMQRGKSTKLTIKLKTLPNSPGVYFHKAKSGEIIYIGKAAVLKNRVRQYFQKSGNMDVKTKALVAEISDTDWLETDSEIDALFLEAEMVKRYMPRYNILLRDDKSLTFVRIDMKSDFPYVSFTRNPADDGADYYGPFYNGSAVKKALRYLRRVFPHYTKLPGSDPGKEDRKLDAHLGLSPVGMTSGEYKISLRKLISYIQGNQKKLVVGLEREMKQAARKHDFENAASLRNKLRNLRELQRRVMFGDKEFLDISKDIALSDLMDLLNLSKIPARIEGYDVSHIGGTSVVASMVVFTNGVSDRSKYRKFKTRLERNDDFANMNEVIGRRFSPKNVKSWGAPDLVLIDGGKGQLDAAIKVRDELGQQSISFIGLAKKNEQIIVMNNSEQGSTLHDKGSVSANEKVAVLGGCVTHSGKYTVIELPKSSHVIKLLQRIRDESHRFAVSYHTTIRAAKQTSSLLDDIPGIGSKTRSKLIRKFGSVRGVKSASPDDIVALIGVSKADLVFNYIKEL